MFHAVFLFMHVLSPSKYHYAHHDCRTELCCFWIIFGDPCSVITEQNFLDLDCLGNTCGQWITEHLGLPYQNVFGIMFDNFGGGITKPKCLFELTRQVLLSDTCNYFRGLMFWRLPKKGQSSKVVRTGCNRFFFFDSASKKPLALVQNGVAPVQQRFCGVHKTLGRLLLPRSKKTFCTLPSSLLEISFWGCFPGLRLPETTILFKLFHAQSDHVWNI